MTVSSDIDLAVLLADTEAEILRVVARPRPVHDRRVRDDPLPPGARRRRRARAASGCARCSASSPTPRSRASTAARCPGAAAVELGHNFSLVHDDIEDGDVERRHRPTLWALHGVPQAINTGDLIFSLSRVALHRLTDLGFTDRNGPPAHAPVRRDVRAAVRGPVHRHRDVRLGRPDDGRALLRHDRAQDGGPDLGLDRGRRAARHRRRRGDLALPRFGWALGLAFQLNDDLLGIWGEEQQTGKVPTDVARHKKTLPVLYAFEHATPADRDRLTALYRARRPGRGRDRRDRRDPRAHRRPRVHARRGAALARRRASPSSTALEAVDPAAREQLRGIITRVISA